jgi:hypothetical protein
MILSTHGILANQIQSFIGLLDLYPNAAAAYSVRKLRSAYTGGAIRVRRSSDNTESDISFNSLGNLDTIALTSFCGAGNGFVTTWYDQSGNARNKVQATAVNQPQIVSSGSVINENSKPATRYNDTAFFAISVPNDFFGLNNITAFSVTRNTTNTETGGILQKRTNASSGNFGIGSLNGNYQFQTRDTLTADLVIQTSSKYNTQKLISVLRNSSGIKILSPESITLAGSVANLTSTGPFEAGSGASYGGLNGTIQEDIIYLSDQTANISAISTNINTYYGII